MGIPDAGSLPGPVSIMVPPLGALSRQVHRSPQLDDPGKDEPADNRHLVQRG